MSVDFIESSYMEDKKTFTSEDPRSCSIVDSDREICEIMGSTGDYDMVDSPTVIIARDDKEGCCSVDIGPEDIAITKDASDGFKNLSIAEDNTDRFPSLLRCVKPKTKDGNDEWATPFMSRDGDTQSSDEVLERTGVSPSQQTAEDQEIALQRSQHQGTLQMTDAGSSPRNTSPLQDRRFETKAQFDAKREIRILKKYKKDGENSDSESQPLIANKTSLKPDPLNTDDTEFTYNMGHTRRGVFVIFNNKTFTIRDMGDRPGTDLDADRLEKLFSKLGFEVWRRNNKTCKEMLQIMEKVAKEDHSDADCFACAIMSHGDEGIIYGKDGIIEVTTLVAPIKTCPTLRGKPKLFFIQACRGDSLDHGVDVADGTDDTDGGRVQRIPLEADFLYAYSTTPGYFSWRAEKKGSWFMQALCNILDMYGEHKELMWMLTRVNRYVARKFESTCSDPALRGKKQIPSIVSQLTGLVYFHRKPQHLQPQRPLQAESLRTSVSVVEIARLVPVYEGEHQSRSAPASRRTSPLPS